MMQLCKILLCVVSKSMLGVPMASEEIQTTLVPTSSHLHHISFPFNWLEMQQKKPRKNSTCSESPHLRKAENDCKRAQIYWPPTVAMQYQSFWAIVSPGPSKPVLTVGNTQHTSRWNRLSNTSNGKISRYLYICSLSSTYLTLTKNFQLECK